MSSRAGRSPSRSPRAGRSPKRTSGSSAVASSVSSSSTASATHSHITRRQLASRSYALSIKAAQFLTRLNVPPNVISIASIFFALFAAYSLYQTPNETKLHCKIFWLAIGVPVGVLSRLLCNMLDGMVAVEGGKRSKSGELYNDVPDRISDAAIFVGFGYAVAAYDHGVTLGWITALAAVLTAYVRLLGASLRVGQHFEGPFAKQHRMFFTWASSILAAGELYWRNTTWILYYTLIVICIGSFVTCARRLVIIQREVEAAPWPEEQGKNN